MTRSEYVKKWRAEHRDHLAAYKRANIERIRASQRRYAAKSIKRRITKAAWHAKNRERILAEKKEWRAAHPGWNLKHYSRRRAALRGSRVGSVDFEHVLAKANGICVLCCSPLGDEKPHFDHIVPLSRGGSHTEDNLQAVHRLCNLKKGTRLIAA